MANALMRIAWDMGICIFLKCISKQNELSWCASLPRVLNATCIGGWCVGASCIFVALHLLIQTRGGSFCVPKMGGWSSKTMETWRLFSRPVLSPGHDFCVRFCCGIETIMVAIVGLSAQSRLKIRI
jgi:hypothetical protein